MVFKMRQLRYEYIAYLKIVQEALEGILYYVVLFLFEDFQQIQIQQHIDQQGQLMNPKQSQLFWNNMLKQDLLKFKKVDTLDSHNKYTQISIPPLQSTHTSIIHSKFNHLQNQYNMHSVNAKNSEWNYQEEQKFFKLHLEYGNKWATIANKMQSKTDNCVKNKFYSTIRKGFRKLNNYIVNIRRKRSHPLASSNKLLKPEFITKLIAIADRNFQQKYEVKPIAQTNSLDIQNKLIELARSNNQYQQNVPGDFNSEEKLLQKIHDFNRNCKKRKGKKKHQNTHKPLSNSNSDQQSSLQPNSTKKHYSQSNIKEVIHYVARVEPPKQDEKNQEKMEQKDQFRVINSQFDLLLQQVDDVQKNRFFNSKVNRTPSASTSFAEGSMNFLIAPSPIVNSMNSDLNINSGSNLNVSRKKISRSSFNSNILGSLNQKQGDQTIQIVQNFPFMINNRCNEAFFKSMELKKQMDQKSYTFDGKIFDRSMSNLPEPQRNNNFMKKYQQWIPILETKESAFSLPENSSCKYQKDKDQRMIVEK